MPPEPHNYMAPMRDGVRLATTVRPPTGSDGPWPAILVRTPYGRDTVFDWQMERLASYGYVTVVQDTRGRFDSEGESVVFAADGWGEKQDGYDTVEWVASQPWCEGRVGMLGVSALGITQYLAAGSAPPHLSCCHVGIASADSYRHSTFQGGGYRKSLLERWLADNRFDTQRQVEEIRRHRLYDDLWAAADLPARAGHVSVPILHYGGWYDCFAQGTLDAFVALQHSGGPGARGRQRLIMGPWPHGMAKDFGEAHLPDDVLTPPHIDPLEWFDRHLKGQETGADSVAPVHYYTIGDVTDPRAGANRWRQADDWPVPCVYASMFLGSDGLLRGKRAAEGDPVRIVSNPVDPVPTMGGANLFLGKGPYDQRPIERRGDVVTFTSDPLAEPLEVTGRVRAHVYLSSSAVDADICVRLCDVRLDGRSLLVCDGICRARYREGFDKAVLLDPGQIAKLDVDLWSTSYVFNPGHRIRLTVSGSNYPRFDTNPHTGEDSPHVAVGVPATHLIHTCGDRASHLHLPVASG